jgi:glucose-6-phosphate dehydrogenase assembly protein OpcA
MMEQISDIERPRRVDLGAIERELREIRRRSGADSDHPAVRASLLSLVAVAAPNERDLVSDLAADVALQHPSRTILLVIDPDAAADEVTAEVSARCQLSFGMRKQVCSEQIIIAASGKSAGELHALVSPLVTSDLPAVLWWRASRWPEPRSFKLLAEVCTRVILDSAILSHSVRDISLLQGLIRDLKALPVADLAWARLTPWRAALAGLYDVPAYRPDLDRLNRILVEYSAAGAGGGAASGQGSASIAPGVLLLVGWLAGRLGWKPQRASGDDKAVWTIDFTGNAGDVRLTLSVQLDANHSDSTPVTSILRTELAKDGGGIQGSSVFSIRLKEGCLETTATIDGEQRGGRVVPCENRGEADLLREELDMLGRDMIYEEALSMAAKIADLMGKA